MKTELLKSEITRKSISKFFKEILNYNFLSSTKSKYAMASGNYNFYFLTNSLKIEMKKSIISFSIDYDDIERIELYIGEDGELYLQIDIDNGVYVIFNAAGAGIELKDEVKEALYNE